MDIRGFFKNKKLNDILKKKLTSREIQVLSLYGSGFDVKEVADVLFLSESTVRTHIKNVFLKIGIDASADCKITLCLFWHMYQAQLTKLGGCKKCK